VSAVFDTMPELRLKYQGVLAMITKVREVHRRNTGKIDCCIADRQPWPCTTIAILDARGPASAQSPTAECPCGNWDRLYLGPHVEGCELERDFPSEERRTPSQREPIAQARSELVDARLRWDRADRERDDARNDLRLLVEDFQELANNVGGDGVVERAFVSNRIKEALARVEARKEGTDE
jgi:hypothetical protein